LLFDQIVKMDLEGIVCKGKDSPYKATEKPSRHWILLPGSVAADRTTPALRDGPNDTGDHQPQTIKPRARQATMTTITTTRPPN
jgi:hypothetical protein